LQKSRSRISAELFWWLGIAVWILAALFWRPAPSVSFASAPSASPKPLGFAVFHDLVAMNTAGVRRFLGSPSELPGEVGVLALLSPSKPVPRSHREEMLEWVEERGGTLLLGHPVEDPDSGEWLNDFAKDTGFTLCTLAPGEVAESVSLQYLPGADDDVEDAVPPFEAAILREIYAETCPGTLLLIDDQGRFIATMEPLGAGTVVQLAEASLLDNEALGRKRTHRFADRLIDRVGPSALWAFDEAYEGIHPSPKFVQLMGASRWRPVFLQIALILLIGYWRRTASFGRRKRPLFGRNVREVTTQARDIGDFYLRAQKSRYALSRALDYLRMQTKTQGADPEAKGEALALVEAAQAEIETGENNLEKHAHLARKMALAGRKLLRSSKGRHHDAK
jgi:hypothetical protein